MRKEWEKEWDDMDEECRRISCVSATSRRVGGWPRQGHLIRPNQHPTQVSIFHQYSTFYMTAVEYSVEYGKLSILYSIVLKLTNLFRQEFC